MGIEISRQMLEETVARVLEACPAIEGCGTGADALITLTMDAAGSVLNEVRGIAEKAGGMTGEAAIAYLAIGAEAAFLDALGPSDLPLQLYRAGRVIGRFMADRLAENLRLAAEGNPQ